MILLLSITLNAGIHEDELKGRGERLYGHLSGF